MIYSSFVFLVLRFVVYLSGEMVGQATPQIARSLFSSADTIVSLLVFFPRFLFQRFSSQRSDHGSTFSVVSEYNGQVSDRIVQASTVERSDTNQSGVSGIPSPMRRESDQEMARSDTNQTGIVRWAHQLPDTISAEEEKDDEDSSLVRFKTNDRLIVLPRWVLDKYGSEEDYLLHDAASQPEDEV